MESLESDMLTGSSDAPDLNSDDYIIELRDGVLRYLSLHKHETEFLFTTLYGIFGDRLIHDVNLRSWLQKSLGCRKKTFETRSLSWLTPTNKGPGRPYIHLVGQQVFDLWVQKSDGRDMVRIPLKA